jgi:hypothetical protein
MCHGQPTSSTQGTAKTSRSAESSSTSWVGEYYHPAKGNEPQILSQASFLSRVEKLCPEVLLELRLRPQRTSTCPRELGGMLFAGNGQPI